MPGAAFYRLEAGSTSGAADLAVIDIPGNQFTAVVPSGTFWVRVRAGNAWGLSAASPDARLVVDGTTGVPEAPQALAVNVAGNTVALAWTPPSSGTLPADYVIEASIAGGPFLAITRTSGTSLTVAGVPPGAYAVRVRAASSAGTGAPTAAVPVTVP